MDRLAAMSLLIAVAETGNLSAASRRLGIPLSTVHRPSSVAAGAGEARGGNPKRGSALGGQLQRFVSAH